MEKVLQWSIAQQSDDPNERSKAPALDPVELAKVLGANVKDDAQMMKEDIFLLYSTHPDISVDDRLTALDDFEALIQNLDNANNISSLGLWKQISDLFTYGLDEEKPQSSEFRAMSAQITGTAVQNNVKSQMDFYKEVGESGMKDLLDLVSNDIDDVKTKAIYAISCLVAHNGPNYQLFEKLNGWEVIAHVLKKDFQNERLQNKVLLRLLNLVKSLLYDEIIEEGSKELNAKSVKVDKFTEHEIISSIINKLDVKSNIDVIDRILDVLTFLKQFGYNFSESESAELKKNLKGLTSIKDNLNLDQFNSLI